MGEEYLSEEESDLGILFDLQAPTQNKVRPPAVQCSYDDADPIPGYDCQAITRECLATLIHGE